MEGEPVEKKLKHFWEQDGFDYIANIGTMKKAIVVRKALHGGYFISESSFFPFPEEYYLKNLTNHIDACELAEKHIVEWVQSLIVPNTGQAKLPETEPNQLLTSTKIC